MTNDDLFPETLPVFPASAPFAPRSETSWAAAIEILPVVGTLRRAVYDAILAAGSHGATDDELQVMLAMDPSTERPRRLELWEANLIRQQPDSYRKTRSGRLAVVWEVGPPWEDLTT